MFTNPILTTHVNITIDWPSMNSITTRGKNTYVENPKGGCQEPFVITQGLINYKNGHFVRPNKVVLKYWPECSCQSV